jgi:hypothetical protein
MFESHHGLVLIMPLVILLVVLYLVYKLISYTRGMRNEAFENAVATRPYDIGSFLAARIEYDNFYQSEGKQLCKTAAGAEEPLCSLYGGVVGPAYSYSPPVLVTGGFAATNGGVTNAPVTKAGLADETFAPITVETSPTFQLDSATFTYYRAAPSKAGNDRPPSFRTADEWQTKTDVERFIDERLGIYRGSAGSGTSTTVTAADYIPYITIGGLNYKVAKDFGSGTQDVLAVSKQDATSRRPIVLYVACGIRAPSTYKQAGIINDAKLFELMLAADSQNKLDGDLSAAAAAVVGAGSASAAAAAGTAANLQLPPLRYVEDAWIKNAALFKQMFEAVKNPARTITNYFNGTNIANTNNTYVNTLQKFVELDRRILKGTRPAGYKFLIPNAYDPALQLFDDNYEPPADPAKHMKCYDLTAQESSLVNYFRRGRGNVENPGVSAEQLASKVQAAICASYGYYTAATAEGVCNCTGCCIPVAYKPRDGRAAAAAPASRRGAAAADEATEEILSKVDNCVHIAQPFQIKRPCPIIRLAPTCGGGAAGLQTEEGFVGVPSAASPILIGQSELVQMPTNYGLTHGFSEVRNLVAATKGVRIGGRDMNM